MSNMKLKTREKVEKCMLIYGKGFMFGCPWCKVYAYLYMFQNNYLYTMIHYNIFGPTINQ